MFSEIPRHLSAGARGMLLPALFALLILADFSLAAEPSAEAIRAIRVWPAQDYTRVTVESGQSRIARPPKPYERSASGRRRTIRAGHTSDPRLAGAGLYARDGRIRPAAEAQPAQ